MDAIHAKVHQNKIKNNNYYIFKENQNSRKKLFQNAEIMRIRDVLCWNCWNHGTAIVQRQAQGYAVALRPGDVT
jgi:hypothetical protein